MRVAWILAAVSGSLAIGIPVYIFSGGNCNTDVVWYALLALAGVMLATLVTTIVQHANSRGAGRSVTVQAVILYVGCAMLAVYWPILLIGATFATDSCGP